MRNFASGTIAIWFVVIGKTEIDIHSTMWLRRLIRREIADVAANPEVHISRPQDHPESDESDRNDRCRDKKRSHKRIMHTGLVIAWPSAN